MVQQGNCSFSNALPGMYSDWSDCIIFAHKILLLNPIFHFPQFFSSPFIITASLVLILIGYSLWLRLCLSLRAIKYSWTHLFKVSSLHLFKYLCHFFQLSSTSSSSGDSSGNLICLSRIKEFCINTEYSKSSSMHGDGRLFKLTSISNNTSSNSNHVNNDLVMDLHRLSFVRPITSLSCPPRHGALERLNFQIILSLLKES